MNAGQRMDQRRLEAALSNLNRRIDDGEEIPDACWSASCYHSVSYEDLLDAYDEQFESNGRRG